MEREKRMKRFLLLTIVALLCMSCLSLAACDKQSNDKEESSGESDGISMGKPYELTFTSNGDGTCYVSEIEINPAYRQDFVLEIPNTSPDGDRVTEIRVERFENPVPAVMTVASYQKIDQILKDKVASGKVLQQDYDKFRTFFLSPKNMSMNGLLALYEKYPICEVVDICALRENLALEDINWLVSAFRELVGYTAEDVLKVYDELYQAANDSNASNKNALLEKLPQKPTCIGIQVTEIVVPDDIEKVSLSLYGTCPSLNRIVFPACITEIDWNFQSFSTLESVVLSDRTACIGADSFLQCPNLKTIYYHGTQEQWEQVSLPEGEKIASDLLCYYSEVQPTEEGNYWHYVNAVPTEW